MREKKQDFEFDLWTHPARAPGDARPTSPREQEHTVRFAKRGLAYSSARKEQQEMEDLTSKFSKLSLNDVPQHDHNVMSVVQHRSIFRTDR